MIDPSARWFADLRAVYDRRNSLREFALPANVADVGVGVRAATGSGPASTRPPGSC